MANATHSAEELERLLRGYQGLIHDLKHPLSLMPHYIEKLRSRASLPQSDDTVQRLASLADRANAMVDSALIATSIFAGGFSPHPIEDDITLCIEDAVRLFEPLCIQNGQKLLWDRPRHPIVLSFDPALLPRVLYNLLSNAIKFSEPPGTISVYAQSDGNTVSITVADSGKGIPPHRLDEIFEGFRHRTSSDRREGSGLGLFIVKAIIEAHGGSITVRSEVGRGTSFIVSLPITQTS